MLLPLVQSIPITHIQEPFLEQNGVSLYLLRLEQTDPMISGNKWFKLIYNLEAFKKQHYSKLLTFGGAYSNHIHATAEACHRFDIPVIGVIRGEQSPKLNRTLLEAQQRNMLLYYISRQDYRLKNKPDFIKSLLAKLIDLNYLSKQDKVYILPEGGSNDLAIQGCALIPKLISIDYNYLCCAIGSGGTFSGLISGVSETQKNAKLLGFSALKGANNLSLTINELLKLSNVEKNIPAWEINHNYHFGGFAKTTNELIEFMHHFYQNHSIKLDAIYTAKMMFGLYQLIKQGYFPRGSQIIAVHTGGLQGNHTFEQKQILNWV